jgi:hypothetical protein
MLTMQFVDRHAGAPVGPQRRVLAQAAQDALAAPSIFNTQPWRWRIGDTTADLRADRGRQLSTIDPAGRLLTVSCGVALHHARTALSAAGFTAQVTYLPDPDQPDLLATIRINGVTPPTPVNLRRYRAMAIRRTDRRPFADIPVAQDALDALSGAVRPYGAHLHYADGRSMVELTVAAGHAATVEQGDPAYLAELAAWTRDAHGADGVPAASAAPLAARPVPIRDFTATGSEHSTIHDTLVLADRYARYAILYTDGDGPADWLAAGEALSALLLEAAANGLATSPMSDLIEVTRCRLLLRDLLSGLGYPQLVVRIGVPGGGPVDPPRSPRRDPSQVVDERS